MRSDLAGGSITIIVAGDLMRPSLLAVRQNTNEIFWLNVGQGNVERSAFDGSNRMHVWNSSSITAAAYIAMDVYKV